jgi:hypothetical protein
VKWLSTVRRSFRDTVLMGFGGWIIYKQVYAPDPNGYLALIGFACMVPSARAAIISILSETGQSSGSAPSQGELPPASSSHKDTGEKP